MRASLLSLLLLLLALASPLGLATQAARALASGRVFLDTDGDGLRSRGETGLPGVRVSDGSETRVSDASGDYALPGAGRFVFVTRPRGIACDPWYRTKGGDFPCRRIPDDDRFFFIQLTDAHVYADAEDFDRFSRPHVPWWLPEFAVSRLALWRIASQQPGRTSDDVRMALNAELGLDLGPGRVLTAYIDAFLAPGSDTGDVARRVRAAFAEVAALGPAFVVSTGDLILEGNYATPAAARRWMDFYAEATRATGVPFHHGIGNNELVGSKRWAETHRHPDYGKGLYRSTFGPTQYAFDRGRMHFVVTDSHPKKPQGFGFYRLRAPERLWVEADLDAHRDRTPVVLNHEPFAWRPDEAPDRPFVQDEGLLERYAVAYALTGHLHRNGVWHDGTTTHISTGALSGARWVLPTSVHERGYRLFWADGERLFSAWKPVGQPAVAFITPLYPGSVRLHPSGAERAGPDEVVAVAADARGPFASVTLLRGGESIPLERWGRYFLRARVAAGTGTLVLIARRADGSEVRVQTQGR